MAESINFIMSTLYSDCDLTIFEYESLLHEVTELVTKWEEKLA